MKYLPDQVFIEYNGTWGMDTLTETELPRGWMVVQSLATVDATTFDMYLANMRTMIMEQLFQADVVIFNRCDDSTDKGKYRRNVKALNRKAQLVYERADGSLDEREEELPFDISGDELEITDADYAIWYMDCLDNPKKYEGKKVSFLALVYNPDKLKKGIFVPGRFAMTCCVEILPSSDLSANIRMRIRFRTSPGFILPRRSRWSCKRVQGKRTGTVSDFHYTCRKAGRRTCLFFIGAECVGIFENLLAGRMPAGRFLFRM